MIVELDGRIVGYARVEWSDQNDGSRTFDQICIVDPIVRGRGIGSALLAWGEERAREIAAQHPVDCPQWHGAGSVGRRRPRRAASSGAMAMNRSGRSSSWSARRSTASRRPSCPRGSRSGRSTGDALRLVFDASGKAFRDHWGSVDDDEASFERFVGDPRTDPSLFVVAFAGEEVAGAVLNVIDDEENAMFDRRRGLLDSVFVRRPYRQRGLGRALVLRSLEVLRERGMTSASLGVDSENPNAALHLYEACGFERIRSSTAWRKPLEPRR